MKPLRIIIEQIKPKTKLLDYCVNAFPVLGSRTAVKKAIAAKRLFLNERPARFNDNLQKGDCIELHQKNGKRIKQIDTELPVVYEDDHLLIVNKPGGIAVNGNRNKTVENFVRAKQPKSPLNDLLSHPVAVHRIDVPTKGLVVLAKTKRALIAIGKQFQQRQVKKTYYAIAHGKLTGEGQMTRPIDGKTAVTDFIVEKTVPSRAFQHLSLVKLLPQTGRTHQLRIHLQTRGHLIVGDKHYAGKQRTILGKGLFLCAAALEFKHPITDKIVKVEIELPARFHRLLDREAARF